MNVVWKRPDGFHNAVPEDFKIVEVEGNARLWLHKRDHKWYPFRISGGWQDQEATQRLNGFVNLLGEPTPKWSAQLLSGLDHSMVEDPKQYFDETLTWIDSLKTVLKGDTWEVELMSIVISEVRNHMMLAKDGFLKSCN